MGDLTPILAMAGIGFGGIVGAIVGAIAGGVTALLGGPFWVVFIGCVAVSATAFGWLASKA